MHLVADDPDPRDWTYDDDCDMWLSADRRTAIQGAIVRQMVRELLRERYGDPRRASAADRDRATRDVLNGHWRHRQGA